MELRGFQKIELQPGEKKTIQFYPFPVSFIIP